MNDGRNCQYSLKLKSKLKELDLNAQLDQLLIDTAIDWARTYHGEQVRASGEPYYSHPLAVAGMVAEYLPKTDVIVTSILHDIVEDTEVTVEMVADTFGGRIAQMVDRLTRDRPDGTKLSVEEILINANEAGDFEVIVIKLFDRIHNLSTLKAKPEAKIAKTITCSLRNFSSICLMLNDIDLEDTFIRYFFDPPTRGLNQHSTSREILLQAFENAEPPK
jgi:(p)ppGpp synthase/HD superfamily hydrolase